MKKSLVLAMAMALGVTASAYAANPFSDVPAGHWAYDAVNKLAAAGVVDGYPDGTYGGDKFMTRYEMAQIVAKAMAKGANVDKLAAEFADELDSLGVRVANLEKKTDNVKITGQIRASYLDADKGGSEGRLRTRLFLNGQVNEDWSYTGRLENSQYYAGEKGTTGDDDVTLNWAFVSGPIGGVKVDAGRMDFTKGDVLDNRGDGVKLSYGDNIKVFGLAMKASNDDYVNGVYESWDQQKDGSYAWTEHDMLDDGDRVYVAGVEANWELIDAALRYYNTDNWRDNDIWEATISGEISKDLTLKGSYFYGDSDVIDGDDSGYLVGLSYRGAKASKVGSWGLYANYSDRPLATYLNPTIFSGGYAAYPADANWLVDKNGEVTSGDGYEGFDIGANVTLAKNIVAGVKYADFESREGDTDEQVLWSEVVFTF